MLMHQRIPMSSTPFHLQGTTFTAIVAEDPKKLIRDYSPLLSALERPSASLFGREACPGIHHKSIALLHGLAKNHSSIRASQLCTRKRSAGKPPAKRFRGSLLTF